MDQPLIIYDGVCGLCNKAITFIIKQDKNAKFKFISLQSPKTSELLKNKPVSLSPQQSIILFTDQKIYTRSDAILNIALLLGGIWKFIIIFKVIPKNWRDYFYTVISNNRYKWFGKNDSCQVPPIEIRARFLE